MAPASLRPPTRLAGYVTDSPFAGIYDEWMEHIPDLLWPNSVGVYAQMRTDAQVSAILSAHTLPIRRAPWALSPSGCRPEVVSRTADDMGLPVVGDDTPGAARTRGVSWSEHLRAALNHLTFGHAGFAMQADVSSGQARLVGLYERLQSTINAIHVDTQGRLLGISQDGRTDAKPPEIRSDQLVWYVHEREGAAWQGRSLIREAFSSWFLKREMLRVASTGHRRFSVGVPTIEWETGANPTPAQMEKAQAAASAARVGETAGLVLPPGARLVLKGLEGSTPDTLAFIKWLDLQISGSVLARWMDLGSTETGSRALATAFVDLFLLSIQSVADFTADTATRQIAARTVAWNEGDDEPVPAVQVGDVGAKHEVTAESLKLLMDSGALSADPGLEAYVRRQFKLPERVGMAKPAPSVQGDTVAAANRPRRRSRREPSDGQLELPIAAATAATPRDLTADELAAGVDFAQIQADHDAAVAALTAALPVLLAPIATSLVLEVGAALTSGGAAALGALTPDAVAVTALGDRIAEEATALAGKSAELAAGELAHIGLPVDAVTVDDVVLAERAQATAQLVASGMAQAASRTALLHNGPGVDVATVLDAVQVDLDEIVQNDRNWITGSLSACMHTAQALGRMAAFQTLADAYGEDGIVLVSSEVNDKSVCPNCHEIDGRRFESFAEAIAAYPAGQMITCAGKDRCRGHLFAARAT